MINKNHLHMIFKMSSMTLLFFCLCAFQTSTWPLIFGSFPSPHIWLTLIVFLIIRWPLYTGIFFTYFLGFVLIFFTNAPLKMIWISLNLLYILIWTLKNRINSSGLISFATLSAFSSFLFSSIYILISSVLETNPTHVFFLHRLTECGLTFIFSIPLYFVYSFIEEIFSNTQKWNNASAHTSSTDEYS
jgi:hypothetical protein